MMAVGQALTAVGALDPVTAEEILTDFRLAVSVRQLHGDPGQGRRSGGDGGPVAQPGPGRACTAEAAPGPGARRQAEQTARGRAPVRNEPTGSSRSG